MTTRDNTRVLFNRPIPEKGEQEKQPRVVVEGEKLEIGGGGGVETTILINKCMEMGLLSTKLQIKALNCLPRCSAVSGNDKWIEAPL